MGTGAWVRVALCAGVLAACSGEVHQESRVVPPGHARGGQDGGAPERAASSAGESGGVARGAGARAAVGIGAGELAGGPSSGSGAERGTSSGGASGGADAPSAAGSGAEADAATTLIDPRRDERQRLVEQYCAACGTGSDCVSQMIYLWFTILPDTCWDEWIASMNCSMANGCYQISGGMFGGGPCLAERTALDSCTVAGDVHGSVTGAMGTCNWDRTATGTGCDPYCADDLVYFYDADCDGPPGGPYRCICRLNSVELGDALIENGTTFYVNTCEGAAGTLASGFCKKFTSCCYTYTGIPLQGEPERTLCECTSAATSKFASCADLAASMKDGKVIDLCPRYEP